MNKIEEMLQELCPNGVEWKELGEVCKVNKGKQLNKTQLSDDGLYPAYNGGKSYSGRTDDYNVEANTIIVSQGGASAGFVNFIDTPFWANAHCYYFLPNLEKVNNRYLYHFIKMKQNYLMEFQHGAGIPALKSDKLIKLKIPLPPLEIQEEIVKILDKFTDYVTELTAELTNRQKQYTYYRDKLLSFEDEVYQVEWKTLGEVAEFNYGYTDKAQDIGDVRFIRITDIDDNGYLKSGDKKYISLTNNSHKYLVNYGDLLMARTGATYGKTLYINTEEPSVYASFLIKITPKGSLDSRYYWHFSKSDQYWNQVNNLVSKAGQPQFNANSLKKVKLPVPSLEIQRRIVQVLDNFDAVCNDLNIGLPKEIELRQKHYEYFRDKLLTFAAAGVYTESRVEEWNHSDVIRLLQWVFGPIKVSLGAVCEFTRGNGLQKKDFVDSGVPCIHYGQIYTYYGLEATHAKSFVSYEVADKLKKAKTNDVIVATTSENIEDVGKALVWEGNEEVCIGGHSCILHTEQNSKYLVYYFQTATFQMQKERLVVGTKVIELYPKKLEQAIIILPPISKQEHIVSILDNFDTLTSDLTQGLPKEIELRQKQYEYYRDNLLNFD